MVLMHYLRLIRPHQWPKNAFVIAPLFFSLKLSDMNALRASVLATIIFIVASSAVYVFNDLRDIDADRAHTVKKNRPLASGDVPIAGALVLLLGLVAAAAGLILVAGFSQWLVYAVVAYVAINVAYSLGMKQIPLLEMFMVASGFVVRLVAGCAAIGVVPTHWIVLNTALVSLLLVVGKRRSDAAGQRAVHRHHAVLREYSPGALDMMLAVLGSGTLMTYILFSVSDYASWHFGTSYLYTSSAFVILGVLRYIQLAHDGRGADDPSTLAARDPILRYCILAWLIVMYLLIY